MKLPLAFVVIALITLSGCDRVRKLTENVGKKEGSAASAPANLGPLVVDIPDGGFDTFTQQEHRLVIVDFCADWNGESRQLMPLWDKLTEEKQGVVVVGKVDVDQFRNLATREGVKNIPDVRIYRDGRQVGKFIGLRDESEIREMVETYAKGLTAAAIPSKTGADPHPTTQPMTKDWMPSGVRVRRR